MEKDRDILSERSRERKHTHTHTHTHTRVHTQTHTHIYTHRPVTGLLIYENKWRAGGRGDGERGGKMVGWQTGVGWRRDDWGAGDLVRWSGVAVGRRANRRTDGSVREWAGARAGSVLAGVWTVHRGSHRWTFKHVEAIENNI